VIETCIKDQVFARCIAKRPKITDSVASQERLREVPYFSGQREPLEEGMGNGQGLTELASARRSLLHFGEKGVGVIVKSLHIGACQDQK